MTRVPRRVLLMVLASVGAWAVTVAHAETETCPIATKRIRLQQSYAATLPDCRAYEQVSPVEKNLNDAIGRAGLTQSSPSGGRVTFGSLGPFPGPGVLGSSEFPTYLSARSSDGGGWPTRGLLPQTEGPQHEIAQAVKIWALTKDLSYALLGVSSSSYLYDTTNERSVPFAIATGGFSFADASADDSVILFEDPLALPGTEGAQEGVPNLYEWDEGRPRLVAADAVAGPSGIRKEGRKYYTQGTVSESGARIFFTSLATGLIYMHEDMGIPVAVSSGSAEWLAATPDGSSVFFTEGGGLYRWCKRVPGGEPCEDEHKEGEPVTRQVADTTADVQGTLGISNDGSYIYFVARGKGLAGENAEGREPIEGGFNLYEWHTGDSTSQPPATTYIASLAGTFDESDWRGFEEGASSEPQEGRKSSRVTPKGTALLFASVASLSGYDNAEHIEIYLYDALDAKLMCVSCNPSGRAATASVYLSRLTLQYLAVPPIRENGYSTRNLSESGSRVFFQTEEALVSKDANGLSDVYEWEGGQLYLISSGQGNSLAYFGDASASGNDVFFFTRQPLVAQDQDDNVDLYDARVDGGIAGQNVVPPPPCAGNTCHSGVGPVPVFGTPASAVFSGAGNVSPVRPGSPSVAKPGPKPKAKCRRGYKRNKHGRCVRTRKAGRG
jgi:hypothetical protein